MEGFTQDDFGPNFSFNNTNVSTDSYDIEPNNDNLSENSDSINNSDNDNLIYSCPICEKIQ